MSVKEFLKKNPFLENTYFWTKNHLPLSKRYGPAFFKIYHLLRESQYWPKAKLEEYQFFELKKIIKHAYDTVPYYNKQWDIAGFNPNDFKSLEDIKKTPFTTKIIFQENLDQLKSTIYPSERYIYVTTGGSTGIPFGFFDDKYISNDREWAFICRQWERVGYKIGNKSVVLRGGVIPGADKGIFWQYNKLRRELNLSSYHMSDHNLPLYLEKINEFKAPFIQAYPSAITILADYMRKNSIPPFSFLKGILTGSENIYDWQRKLLEEVFQCRVYSWYGHAEKAVLAGECEKNHDYHIFPEYGYTELLDKNGNEVRQEGEIGEIVATGFNNYVMPFIRYRTMDLGVYTGKKCQCGRNYPLLKRIEGRLQELIITGDNRRISMAAINMHDSIFDHIRQFQFYQEKKGEVVFNIVKKETYSEQDTKNIQKNLEQKLGSQMRLYIKFVNNIPRTKSGKFRFLIQKLPVKFND